LLCELYETHTNTQYEQNVGLPNVATVAHVDMPGFKVGKGKNVH